MKWKNAQKTANPLTYIVFHHFDVVVARFDGLFGVLNLVVEAIRIFFQMVDHVFLVINLQYNTVNGLGTFGNALQ